MKKIVFYTFSLLLLVSCNNNNSNNNAELVDSLKNANIQLKEGYDNLLSSVNQINDGFKQIVDAENNINKITFVDDNSDNVAKDPTADIKDNLQFILEILENNKNQIKLLEDKLSDKSLSSEQLQTMVENFKVQLETKQNEIIQLKKQLEEKNYQIGKMGDKIDQLEKENNIVKDENTQVKEENKVIKEENNKINTENAKIKDENQQVKDENEKVKDENQKVKNENESVKRDNKIKEQIVNNQDAQLNTAFYVFGNKSELKQHRILSDGDILTNVNFDRNYFTKIDIRNFTTLPLQSKNVKIMSKHPSNSYSLLKDSKGEYTLRITNPTEFWSLTKYLVIKVK